MFHDLSYGASTSCAGPAVPGSAVRSLHKRKPPRLGDGWSLASQRPLLSDALLPN